MYVTLTVFFGTGGHFFLYCEHYNPLDPRTLQEKKNPRGFMPAKKSCDYGREAVLVICQELTELSVSRFGAERALPNRGRDVLVVVLSARSEKEACRVVIPTFRCTWLN